MTQRQDGKETRRRLLTAAGEIFSQKGYRDAKVTDICKRAGTNVASVKYYFRDKASLYADTWRHAFQQFEEPVFSEMTEGSPQEQLREYVQILIKNFTSKERTGHFIRLYMMELVHPTGLIQDDWLELIEPHRQKLHHIIREIIGQKADHQSVVFCELSIVTQCRLLLTIKHDDLEYLLDQPLDAKLIERQADHIADFSLAGIQAVGRRRT